MARPAEPRGNDDSTLAAKLPVGRELELEVESLAAGGEGVARAPGGAVVFVPWTAPGDRVRVRITESRRRFARATLVELIEPSPDRRAPECEAFGECGGCSWQHLAPDAQLDAKRRIVVDAIERIGRLEVPGPVALFPSPRPYGTRTRARLLVEGGRVGYRRRRSRALRAVSACPILAPELERELARLAASPPRRDGEIELFLDAEGRAWRTPLGGAHREPRPRTMACGALRLRVSEGAFSQSHATLVERLADEVTRAAGAGALALELYAGCGLFTLGLAGSFQRVVAIESSRAAAADLRVNLAGAPHVDVFEARVEAALGCEPVVSLRPDVVVLDPPRVGVDAEAIETLARLGADRIVYVSCDPATLARDVARLGAAGHRLSQLSVFDCFPQTPHVEVLALLERQGAPERPGDTLRPDG